MGESKEWEDAAKVVLGAYRLFLSSQANPTHPRNIEYYDRFMKDPLRYAVLLLNKISEERGGGGGGDVGSNE